jgi:hypothetical protein
VVPPWFPAVPGQYGQVAGSYLYPYNLIPVSGPATTDARGIRATDNADPAMTGTGLPGSMLGVTANKGNMLGTSSNMKYHISAGPAPVQTVQTGISPGAGVVMPTVEDPGGAPPKNAVGGLESAQSTTVPAVPGNSQVLEDPKGGQPAAASAAPTSTAAPAPSAPTAQVWPQTPGFAPGAYGTGTGPSISAGQ